MRLALVPLLLAVTLLPAAAHAQGFGTGGTSGGNSANELNLAKEDFEITLWRQESADKWVFLNSYDLMTFFNRARCDCKTPVRIQVLTKNTGRAKITRPHTADVKLRVGGAPCKDQDTTNNHPFCTDIPDSVRTEISAALTNGLTVDTTADVLFARVTPPSATDDRSVCEQDSQSTSVWLWIDVNKDGVPDLTDAKLDFTIDGQGPTAPDGVEVRAGQEALEVTWQLRESAEDDQGFIVFCSRGGDLPVFKPGTFSPPYSSVATACAVPAPAALTSGYTYASDVPLLGLMGSSPPQFRNLDPAFACSGMLARTETKYRIKTLQNDIPYLVGVAAVDLRGNASPIEKVLLQKPVPTRDFYRGYREAGGAAEGGYCALARRGAGHGLGYALLAGVPLIALVVRRARRARRDGRGS